MQAHQYNSKSENKSTNKDIHLSFKAVILNLNYTESEKMKQAHQYKSKSENKSTNKDIHLSLKSVIELYSEIYIFKNYVADLL